MNESLDTISVLNRILLQIVLVHALSQWNWLRKHIQINVNYLSCRNNLNATYLYVGTYRVSLLFLTTIDYCFLFLQSTTTHATNGNRCQATNLSQLSIQHMYFLGKIRQKHAMGRCITLTMLIVVSINEKEQFIKK